MVRRSKRPPTSHLAAFELAGDGRNHRYFQRFGGLQGWEDTRQAGREQRFTRTWWPAHQQVVTARGGDFERTFGDLLALDLLEVRSANWRFGLTGLRRLQNGGAAQVRQQCQQIWRGDDLDVPRPCRFGTLGGRADQSPALARRMKRREQHARRRRDPPVQLQLSDDYVMAQRLGIDGTDRSQQA